MPHSLTILLVAPQPVDAIAGSLSDMAEHCARVERVATVAAAAAYLAGASVGAVLVDQACCPVSDLPALRRRLGSAAVPVLLLLDEPLPDAMLREAGVDDALPKRSLDAEQLGRALRYAVERAALQTQLHAADERLSRIDDLSSEAHWSLVLAQPLDPAWPVAQQTAHLYAHAKLAHCNHVMAALYGVGDSKDMPGVPLAHLLPPDAPESAELLGRFIVDGHMLRDYEIQHRTPRGELHPLLTTWAGRYVDGLLVGVDCVQRDISARRQAQRESSRLAAIVESSNDAIISKDFDNIIVTWNRGAELLYGWTAAEAIGQSIELIVPLERQHEIAELAERVRAGEGIATLETVRVRKDGRQVDVSLGVSPMRDEHDRLIGTAVVARDITAAKRAAEQIRESERRFRDVVDNSRDVLYRLNLRTLQYEFVSPSVEEIMGIALDEVLADGFLLTIAHIHPDDLPLVLLPLEELVAHGGIPSDRVGTEYRLQTRHRGWRWFSDRRRLIQDADGAPLAIVGSARDITESKQALEGLRAAELRYRTLVEQLPAMIYTAGVEENSPTTYVSPQVEDILGFTPEEWLAHPDLWLEQIHPEDRQAVLTDVSFTKAHDAPHAVEFRALTRDGRTVWLRDSTKIARDEAGQPLFMQGITLDITDRKQIEESLRASEARLKQAQSIAHLAHFELDIRAADMHWSDEMFWIYGLEPHSPVPDPTAFLALIHPDDRHLLEAFMREALSGTFNPSMDHRIVRPNGDVRHVNVQYQLVHDAAGQPIHLVGTVQDVTDRVHAESEVRASQERLAGIVNSAMDAVITIDAEQRITLFNPAAELMFGYSSAEMIGQPVTRLMPARFADAHSRQVAVFERHGETTRAMGAPGSIFGVRADGQEFPIEASISQVEVGGQKLFTAILRDVTEIKRAEAELLRSRAELERANDALELRVEERTRELEQAKDEAERANAAKSEFLSRMSHELRTPMNSILGFAQIMEMDALSSKQSERLGYILSAGQHLLRLINEVLDMERVESGRLQVTTEAVQVASAVKLAVDLVEPLAQQRRQTIEDTTGGLLLYVQADQQRLAQVVLNLLSNATKYGPADSTIRISAARRPGGSVRISVQDEGPGIAPEHQLKLFQPFERLHAAGSTVEGTGLGLALSKRLVELMGGSMGVDTEAAGSVFWLELPETSATWQSTAALRDDGGQSGDLTRQHTLVYIEDNLANVQVLEHILADDPRITLISAMQGQLGLDLAREHKPSLILLDLHLPDMSGDEVLRRLQADPATQATPVVVLSADAAPSRMRQLRGAGASEFLSKPLDIRELLEVVMQLLGEVDVAPRS